MATWYGIPKKRRMEMYLPENHGYGSYEEVECGWEYNTTSDCFRPYTQVEGKEKEWNIFSQENAEALLYSLMDWYNLYVGAEHLDAMIQEIRRDRVCE